ncbi:hypothetical protein Cgig2_015996 [Carnegiea gigantea]|uniref:Uncharacterized protein n=1 Tax=Carnegiea gigantea TaxID=171969 RepID=A0A9Q1KM99_9CARY|nr:hypothetical protein Cgig2_015996 [Carnegiea gigantea]
MGLTLWDELTASTAPRLSLSSLPSHKEAPGALTPPLQPKVSVPFKWEEVPGRPRPTNRLSPPRPSSGGGGSLELPPSTIKMTKVPSSPPIMLDGPRVGQALSDRFWLEGPGPKKLLGLVESASRHGLDQGKSENDFRAPDVVSCRWPNEGLVRWDGDHYKGSFDYSHCDGGVADVNMTVKIKTCKRSNGRLHRDKIVTSDPHTRLVVEFLGYRI